jgi:predicted ATPase
MKAVDIPQADSLSRVRELVQSVKFGAIDVARLQRVMTLHPRHVGYHLHAARILNWLDKSTGEWSLTSTGNTLLSTIAGSQEERSIFRQSIEASDFLKVVAPNLFGEEEPAQDLLSVRIQEVAQIAPATARRRASTLLRWRTQSLPVKARLASFQFDEQDDEEVSGGIELHSVEVSNFRLLRDVRLEMAQSVVLTGESSTGKSIMIDAIALTSDFLKTSLSEGIERRVNAFTELLWFGEGESFALAFEFRLPKSVRYDLSRARYEIEIGRDDSGNVGLLRENFFLRPRDIEPNERVQATSPKGWRKVFGTNAEGQSRFGSEHPASRKSTSNQGGRNVLGFATLPEDGERFPAALQIRHFLMEQVAFVCLKPEVMMEPALDGTSDMSMDGRGFVDALALLAQQNQEHFEEWQAHALEAMPKVERFEIVAEADRRALRAHMRGGFVMDANQLSFGERRVMALALIPYQFPRGGLVCVECPEQGLHPSMIEPVSQALNRGGRVQVLVTTHSPNWVGVTPIERIRVFQPEAGGIRILVGPQLDWLQEELDERLGLPLVFASGMLN